MKKWVVVATLTMIMTFTAAGFEATLTAEKEVANTTSPAIYNLNIQNEEGVNNTYSISTLSPKSSWIYHPSNVKVSANSNKTFEISVSPTEQALQETYGFETKIRESSSGEIRSLSNSFRVEQPYRLDVIGFSKNRDVFDPGEVAETEIGIKNLDNQPVQNYRVESSFEDQERSESGTSILPGGERLYEFNYRIDEDRNPGTIPIEYNIILNEEVEQSLTQRINVSEVRNVSRSSSSENRLVSVTNTKSIENRGNTPINTSLTAEIPSYISSITSGNPEPDKIQTVEGKEVMTWNVKLEQDEEFSAEYTTQYWIPAAALTLLSLGLIAIKKLGNQVSLRKTAESSPGEVKINLEINNKSEKTFEQLELEEFIPDIATVDEKFSMNTPKVRKTSEGTKLSWKIQNLEPGDQRIIQYKIKPKVDVEEDIDLKSAVIKDENGQKLVESNGVSTEFTPDTT